MTEFILLVWPQAVVPALASSPALSSSVRLSALAAPSAWLPVARETQEGEEEEEEEGGREMIRSDS